MSSFSGRGRGAAAEPPPRHPRRHAEHTTTTPHAGTSEYYRQIRPSANQLQQLMQLGAAARIGAGITSGLARVTSFARSAAPTLRRGVEGSDAIKSTANAIRKVNDIPNAVFREVAGAALFCAIPEAGHVTETGSILYRDDTLAGVLGKGVIKRVKITAKKLLPEM